MPAWEEEILAAEDEGVKINYLSAPQEILSNNGKVTGLRCIRMELGEPDSSGRRRPIPVPGSEYDLNVDQVIAAIGQIPDLSPFVDEEDLTYQNGEQWKLILYPIIPERKESSQEVICRPGPG